MIIKIDVPDEACFKHFKRFIDNTFDFELVKMYDICSNQDIQYMQILGLKMQEIDRTRDPGIKLNPNFNQSQNKDEKEFEDMWRDLLHSGNVEPLFGNIRARQSDTSINATENT